MYQKTEKILPSFFVNVGVAVYPKLTPKIHTTRKHHVDDNKYLPICKTFFGVNGYFL